MTIDDASLSRRSTIQLLLEGDNSNVLALTAFFSM